MHDATFGVVDKVVPYGGGAMLHKWTDEELWLVSKIPELAAYSCRDPALSAYVPGRRILLEICRG